MSAAPNDASGAGSGNGPAPLARLRRLMIPALCVALAAAAAVALVVVSTSSSGDRATSASPSSAGSTPVGSGPGAPSVAAVQAMLDRHGADVTRRDRRAFLADIDGSGPAVPYRAAQSAMFDNLADVPLTAWSYQVSVPVTGGSELHDAAARYHAPVLIARIALGYQLRGIDPAPTTHDVWLTFVRRSGKVRIVSDSDLTDQGGQSWHGPWDFGPVSAYRGAACLILAHSTYATRLPELAAAVDAAAHAVTDVWGAGWARQVAVFVPDTQDELQAVLGGPAGPDLAAQALGDSTNPHTGLRVVLDPDGQTRLSAAGLRIVLRHEITHLAAWSVTSDVMPTWLVEGFADYVGNLDSGQPVTVAATELRGLVRAGQVPAALPTTNDFANGGAQLPQIYEQAWLACRLIAALAGTAGLVRVYRAVAASTGTPVGALDSALRTVVHMTSAQFTARWRQYLRAELG